MVTNSISIKDTSLVEVRLAEIRDTGLLTINDRHFNLQIGSKIDITSSLHTGVNTLSFFVNTNSLRDSPSRLLDTKKREWVGKLDIYLDGEIAGSYSKRGISIIGGKENIVATVEINVEKDLSKPTVLQIIRYLSQVKGITDADKASFLQSSPRIIFENGVAIHTWKNHMHVNHVFVADRTGKCVYGGYVGWAHTNDLASALESLHNSFDKFMA